jgi:hypothetical protein
MKNLILIFLTFLMLAGCDKKNDENNQLPPLTTTGANTAGCLVNGRVFIPRGSSQFGSTLSCFYQQDQDGYHLGLSIVEKDATEDKSVGISTNPLALVENNTYNLVEQTNNGSNYNSNFGQYIITNNVDAGLEFYTTNNYRGEVKIIKLNTQQRIISGTFWYDAINPQGDIVKIRDGRFDMRYVN